MESQKRLEERFFLSLKDCQLLISQISAIKSLYRCYFDHPVTETIYFTLPDAERSLYKDQYIRIRKYADRISETMVIDDSSAYLEIKTKGDPSYFSVKKRYLLTNKQAVEILSGLQERPFELFLADCPSLCPFVGTQVQRLHWQAGDLRITVDPNTYFFGFTDVDMYKAHQIGRIDEVKIEFKFDNSFDYAIRDLIFNNLTVYSRPSDYLEKRIRGCYDQWAHKQQFS
jgi:hypothetical protein